jgi:hypothetical protein
MSFTISLVHRANIHIAQAIEWCTKQEQDLEIRFLKSLDKSITYIQKNPFKSQIRYRNVRVKFMRNPKFGVHYVIDVQTIYIIGVFHTSQDSSKW